LIAAIIDLEEAKRDPDFARLADHQKFQRSVGATVGVRAVVTGFFRVPRTLKLLVSDKSKMALSRTPNAAANV